MATAIFMPKMGMTMQTGTLIRWLKQAGDRVERNEPIMEIETDKIVMEADAPASGVLLATLVKSGDTVPVLCTIGWIGEAGEQPPDTAPVPVIRFAAGFAPPSMAQPPMAQPPMTQPPMAQPSMAQSPAAQALRAAAFPYSGFPATPYAKTLLRQQHISADALSGSGPHGELFARDVPLTAQALPGEQSRTRLSGRRRRIAQRMQQSHAEIPAVTQDTDIDVTALLLAREEWNERRTADTRITINDCVLRAVSIASRAFPAMRTALHGDELVTFSHVHLGMAVSMEEGLIVPVIKHADALPLFALSGAAKELAARARKNRLLPDDCAGSTLTVSNLGMYGVAAFTPIINPPNPAVVGICCVREEPALREDGSLFSKKLLRISVTFDHRIMDGATAAQFALRVKELLEQPQSLL